MKRKTAAIPAEAEQAVHICQQTLHSLVAAYLHGSAVSGGLRPDSDVDIFVVVDEKMAAAARAHLTAELLNLSHPPGHSGGRAIELVVFHRAELNTPAYPARSEFVFGEWMREAFEAGEIRQPEPDPELTLLLAQARREAVALVGPNPVELLPDIPHNDVRRATGDLLAPLLDTVEQDHRNVLLTLARMWRTLSTGEFVPKDIAAEWAMARLSPKAAATVHYARHSYVSGQSDDWLARRAEVAFAAAELSERVRAFL